MRLATVLLPSAYLAVSRCAWIACVQEAAESLVQVQLRSPRRMRSEGHGTSSSLALPDPTLKINIEKGSGVTRINDLCSWNFLTARCNCITVMGGMRIIIHVQQWLLNLPCVLVVPTRYREREAPRHRCMAGDHNTISRNYPSARMRAAKVTVVVPCVCVSVRSFLPPRASRLRNIGTYVFTATRKNFYNRNFR